MNTSEYGNGPKQGTSAESEITGGPRGRPERRLQTTRLLEGYHLTADNAREADVEAAF